MKSLNVPLLFASIFLTYSCVEKTQILTRINPDGSCYRELNGKADSVFMIGNTAKRNPFAVDLDSTWKISWQYKTSEIHKEWPLKTWTWDTTYKNIFHGPKGKSSSLIKSINVWASRNYKSVNEMASSFRLKESHSWHDLKVRYSLDKKFRWFYTYYIYKEVYPKIKTFDRVPLDKYMNNDEVSFWFNGNTDLLKGMNGAEMKEFISDIESKFNSWLGNNLFDISYDILINNYNYLKGINISRERLISAKDSILVKYIKDFDIIKNDPSFEDLLDKYFKTKFFSTLINQKDNPVIKQIDTVLTKPFEHMQEYFAEGIDYRLLMPGKILQAKYAVLHNDTLVWNITAYRMVPGDFEISAQSRRANNWAFILSGFILLVAVGTYFIKTR
jgi:hypothetical protein